MNQKTGNLEDQQWYQDAITRNRNQNTRETLRVIEGGGLDKAEFADFKDKYFTKLIANTDEDIQAFIKRVINRKQDDEFNKLSQEQMKEFLKSLKLINSSESSLILFDCLCLPSGLKSQSLYFPRILSALNQSAFRLFTTSFASVVLPDPGKPMIKIFFIKFIFYF